MESAPLDAELAAGLADLATRAAEARDPWWVIGSAAVVLHGARTTVADLDLLMSPSDTRTVLQGVGAAAREGSGSDLFHSAIFGTIQAPLPIEVMADLRVNTATGWRKVTLETRQVVHVGAATLYVPERQELIDLLRLFGRDKDIERAALLAALPAG